MRMLEYPLKSFLTKALETEKMIVGILKQIETGTLNLKGNTTKAAVKVKKASATTMRPFILSGYAPQEEVSSNSSRNQSYFPFVERGWRLSGFPATQRNAKVGELAAE